MQDWTLGKLRKTTRREERVEDKKEDEKCKRKKWGEERRQKDAENKGG
jgi:hypothetical protein